MKTKIFCMLTILISSMLYSQSSIVYDAGTTIDVGIGADVCAQVITVNGTFSGSGTFCNGPLSVKIDSLLVPYKYELSQNYPNPFNPVTTIKYSIPKSSQVVIKVLNIIGTEISTLVNEEKPVGIYEVNWNAENLPSGVYFYRIQAGSFVQTRKMILLK